MKKKVIELLKSGNFTLAYQDSCYCSLHVGKKSYDDCTEENEIDEFGDTTIGYCPAEVEALVKALGGKVVSR